MELKTIFEDEEILVIEKPSGWIVNESGTTTGQPVIQSWLNDNFNYELAKNRDLRSGIVHRLDKETSGILIVAKTEKSFYDLQRQFKERIIKKTYIALVHGNIEPKEGIIKITLGRLPWRRDRFGVVPGGRESVTIYKSIHYFQQANTKNPQLKNYSLVEFYPQTGRTHQIRIHAKYIGHPIVGDEFYAGRKTARNDRKWCPRLFLHATKISFLHPKDGKEVVLESKLPNDLDKSFSQLTLVS